MNDFNSSLDLLLNIFGLSKKGYWLPKMNLSDKGKLKTVVEINLLLRRFISQFVAWIKHFISRLSCQLIDSDKVSCFLVTIIKRNVFFFSFINDALTEQYIHSICDHYLSVHGYIQNISDFYFVNFQCFWCN
jgi:hypothetical protein